MQCKFRANNDFDGCRGEMWQLKEAMKHLLKFSNLHRRIIDF